MSAYDLQCNLRGWSIAYTDLQKEKFYLAHSTKRAWFLSRLPWVLASTLLAAAFGYGMTGLPYSALNILFTLALNFLFWYGIPGVPRNYRFRPSEIENKWFEYYLKLNKKVGAVIDTVTHCEYQLHEEFLAEKRNALKHSHDFDIQLIKAIEASGEVNILRNHAESCQWKTVPEDARSKLDQYWKQLENPDHKIEEPFFIETSPEDISEVSILEEALSNLVEIGLVLDNCDAIYGDSPGAYEEEKRRLERELKRARENQVKDLAKEYEISFRIGD